MAKITSEKALVIRAMEEHNVLIDNHTNDFETLIGLVEFVNEYKPLAGCFNARHFCLNEVYLNEIGILHLSQMSIGGVLYGIESKDIDKYNKTVCQEGGKIKCIHLPDGTKVYPSSGNSSKASDEEIESWEEELKLGIPDVVSTVFNSKGLRIHEVYSDGLNIYYEYDEFGRITNIIRR